MQPGVGVCVHEDIMPDRWPNACQDAFNVAPVGTGEEGSGHSDPFLSAEIIVNV